VVGRTRFGGAERFLGGLAVGLAVGLTVSLAGWVGVGHAFHARFERVVVGHTEQQVFAALGPPDHVAERFRLGQRGGFEAEYEAARVSGATRFLVWRRGIDVSFVVGLDPGGRVVVKAVGGT